MNKTFVLSDESVNRHGFIVRNSAINLEQFRKNPIMYYNHDPEKGVIGRWENLRFKNGELLGEPVFDEKDEFALKIKDKVNNDFIKSASIGFNASSEDIDTFSSPPVALKIDLFEISVCDVPSNKNAIALYSSAKEKIINLDEYLKVNLNINQNKKSMNELLTKLGQNLKIENPTEESILNAVQQLQAGAPDEVEGRLSLALQMNLIDKASMNHLRGMGKNNPVSLFCYLSDLEKSKQEEIKKKVDYYFLSHSKKFKLMSPDQSKAMKEFAGMNYDLFCRFMEGVPEHITLSELIAKHGNQGEAENRNTWTLNDYRKKDPGELQRNPELYQELLVNSKKK